jgi:hypothetical protein
MFKWINKQGVQSDEGFIVQFTGRSTARYTEMEKVLTFSLEPGRTADGLPSEIIDPSSIIRWDGDPAGAIISPDERARLIRNISAAFEFQGLRLVVGGSPISNAELLARFSKLR